MSSLTNKISHVMIGKSREDRQLVFPQFLLSGEVLNVCNKVTYPGHFCTDDLSHDADIERQCLRLYAQSNTLVRKFHMCIREVKVNLFRTYCYSSPLYTAQLWYKYRQYSICRLIVVFYVLRILLRISGFMSVSQMFAELHVPASQAVIRNIIFKFMCRLEKSENCILTNLVDSTNSDSRFF